MIKIDEISVNLRISAGVRVWQVKNRSCHFENTSSWSPFLRIFTYKLISGHYLSCTCCYKCVLFPHYLLEWLVRTYFFQLQLTVFQSSMSNVTLDIFWIDFMPIYHHVIGNNLLFFGRPRHLRESFPLISEKKTVLHTHLFRAQMGSSC